MTNNTLSDLFIVCSHGRRSAHEIPRFHHGENTVTAWNEMCPGGRPVTLEDLGGEKVWWCALHNRRNLDCPFGELHNVFPALIVPIPQDSEPEEVTNGLIDTQRGEG